MRRYQSRPPSSMEPNFLEFGGYVNFVPGTITTIVSSLAIILSFMHTLKKDS